MKFQRRFYAMQYFEHSDCLEILSSQSDCLKIVYRKIYAENLYRNWQWYGQNIADVLGDQSVTGNLEQSSFFKIILKWDIRRRDKKSIRC